VQAYEQGFARVYNAKWSYFAKKVAPVILDFYAATPIGQKNKYVLDVCCGTGHLAVHFLENGYRVVGIDLSESMLNCARENARPYIDSGQAKFIQANASDFTLDERFGLVVSTFDSLNHLEEEQTLRKCLECVHAVSDGYFIFDVNTRKGLRRWNGIQVDDNNEEAFIITRGIYDEQSERAWTRITGFVRAANGLYERFDQTTFNTVFAVEKLIKLLGEVGWKNVYSAQFNDLETPSREPEKEEMVFLIASK
jgi:SAM-dependent methyltransferase